MKKDLISILDIDKGELDRIIADAIELKKMRRSGVPHPFLAGMNLAMIFEKSSTRTRISFEVGMNDLGGHALFLNTQDLQIGRGEEIKDTARVASRFVSGVMIRAYRHQTIQDFARYSSIPVINALSDREHPCQILADLMTIRERFGSMAGLRLAWVGDGDNVCNSMILSSILTGMEITVATPPGYEPPKDVTDTAGERGAKVRVVKDPEQAVAGAHIVVTDTWVSMGEEGERGKRLEAFKGFTVTAALMKKAEQDAVFMHCLPAHRGQEVTDEVIEGPQSVVFDEAENRLHAQKALLVSLLAHDVKIQNK
jgi:ornithine carbamoyltransferase